MPSFPEARNNTVEQATLPSASAAKYCEKGAVNQLAASAASPDYVRFQAVIKSAASAASREPKSREGSSRGVQDGGSAGWIWAPWKLR